MCSCIAANRTAARRIACPQMDPCCIAADMVDFDAVLLSGVLEKIPSPKAPLGERELPALFCQSHA